VVIPRSYETPTAFKAALEQRLRSASATGVDFARRRQLLVFDRCLARIGQVFGSAATLKGGLVLELRLERARTTRDIDLRMVGPSGHVLERLQEAGRIQLGDFMSFEILVDPEQPEMMGDGLQYVGQRFRAECRLAGKVYGQPFGVDVAFGDPILGEPETIIAEDLLGFAGVPPPELRVYPVESHIAEKLHAYTLPRRLPNTRVKDLPDLALLAQTGPLDARRVRSALQQMFEFRATHPVPTRLPDPPAEWDAPYARMATDNELPWATLAEVVGATREFLDPVLGTTAGALWEPRSWAWARHD
jgi:hypothetical protein